MLLLIVMVKLGFFWISDIHCNILDEDEQQITCNMKYNELPYQFANTFVYDKCKNHLRRSLWDKMIQHSTLNDNPWCAVGDFNVITFVEEKL